MERGERKEKKQRICLGLGDHIIATRTTMNCTQDYAFVPHRLEKQNYVNPPKK